MASCLKLNVMQTIEITKENFEAAISKASPELQEVLNIMSGAKKLPITERVKTFGDAAVALYPGLEKKQVELLEYSGSDPDMISAVSYLKLVIIIRVLNEGWIPNWDAANEPKYVPIFKNVSGFGLAYCDCGSWYASAHVGSRLCFKSKDLLLYAVEQFKDIYRDYLTLTHATKTD